LERQRAEYFALQITVGSREKRRKLAPILLSGLSVHLLFVPSVCLFFSCSLNIQFLVELTKNSSKALFNKRIYDIFCVCLCVDFVLRKERRRVKRRQTRKEYERRTAVLFCSLAEVKRKTKGGCPCTIKLSFFVFAFFYSSKNFLVAGVRLILKLTCQSQTRSFWFFCSHSFCVTPLWHVMSLV